MVAIEDWPTENVKQECPREQKPLPGEMEPNIVKKVWSRSNVDPDHFCGGAI